jgi:hypothetical protein
MPTNSNARLWHRWILFPLWGLHFIILESTITLHLLQTFFPDFRRRLVVTLGGEQWVVPHAISQAILFLAAEVSTCSETARWQEGCLETTFYLQSSAFKAAYFTWILYGVGGLFWMYGPGHNYVVVGRLQM